MRSVKDLRRENLQFLVEKYGTMKKLNEALDRNDNSLTQILNQSVHSVYGYKRTMGDKIARNIEEKLNLGYGWMDADHSHDAFPEETDMIYLRKLDVRACCGNAGYSNLEEDESEANIEIFGVNQQWFQENVNTIRTQGYDVITARGDSMEPTFKNGDMLIVDRHDTDARREGIFCCLIDGDIYIKRLQKVPGAIRFVPDNKSYDSFEIKKEEFDQLVKVIGRIVSSMNLKRYE